MQVQLRPYQRDGIRHLIKNKRACLFYDPGLGKTITTLLSIVLLKQRGQISRVLVVAPLRVAQSVWRQEVEKWDETRHLTTALLHGPKKGQILSEEADIQVINYDGLTWLLSQYGKEDPFPWDLVVFDELSKLKATGTVRFKALSKCVHKFPRRWGLTGTPAPNSLLELFGQMKIIDPKLLGANKFRFQQALFFKPYPEARVWLPKAGAEAIIAGRLAPVCHRLAAKDHLTLPPTTKVFHRVDIGARAMKRYEDLERDFLTEINEETITAQSAGVAWGKLQQIAQGFLYDETQQAHWMHTAKIEVLQDIIEEASGQSILIFYRFRADLEILQKTIPGLHPYSTGLEQAWNRGDIPVMAANPASAGHGLNLQAGGHIIVWYTMEPSLEKYIQGNGRLDRQGQTQPVIIHHLIASGTIDEDTVEVLEKRATIQAALLKGIKQRQRQPSDRAA